MRRSAAQAAERLSGLISTTKAATNKPAGWYDLDELTIAFNMRWRHNASARAISMYRRGVLERMPWHFTTAEGQPVRSFIYRPVRPAKTIEDALQAFLTVGQAKVPKGWARPIEIAERLRISAVAVREMAKRHKIKPRIYRTLRGASGLHENLYYPVRDVVALHTRKT